jgi:hypothetical protein
VKRWKRIVIGVEDSVTYIKYERRRIHMPANRIAALAAFLTGLSGAIVGVANVMPTGTQSTILAVAGGLGAIATALHFMLGSQKVDAHAAAIELKKIEMGVSTQVKNPETKTIIAQAAQSHRPVIDNPQA